MEEIMKKNKKWFRMWTVLSFAFTVFIRVYWYRIRKKSDSEWEKLWGRIGREFRHILFELEGLLIKVGQFLSIRADLLPNAFIKEIQDLVDHVPPSTWDVVKTILEREWNGSIDEVLLTIEQESVASASIGEVYRGRLKDGTDVAIKVQRSTIKSIMRTDFRSLAIIIWFARHFAPVPKGFINFKMLFQELKHVIERELDFKKELETIVHFRQRFSQIEKLSIPKVYPDLSTSQVLVMEWIDGARITDVSFIEQSEIDRADLSVRLFRLFIPQWLEAGTFHADPHAGNVLMKSDGTLVLLDFGMVGEISKKDALNFQDLLQAILVKNYSEAVDILVELGFLLPNAERKPIENLLKEALSIDLGQLKEMDLFAIKKDLNAIIQTLPIQVPTRFIFLGRSFVTIEGILHIINPNEEILQVMKPAFVDWLDQSNQSKWKMVLKWINAQPIFQMFHSITDLIETPQRFLEQKEMQQQREFNFTYYENQKKQAFYLCMVGTISTFVAGYLHNSFMWKASLGVIGISLLGYVICSWKQRKWLKSGKKK
jgi:predicted unusual protein kinase regulating ubiquinone biosynthesis (AarF/ABC1/UbiB family)